MQYSTLSLEDSEGVSDQNFKSRESVYLQKENQDLKALIRELQKKLNNLVTTNGNFTQKIAEYEEQMVIFEEEIR